MDSTIIQKIVIWIIPLIFAVTVHEVAHGWVASFFGDQTARLSGRLTLNPVKHIDVVGTLIIPLTLLLVRSPALFGWAKPVPVDARNLVNPRPKLVLIALAGPLSNLVMAFIWGGIAKWGFYMSPWFSKPMILMGIAGININIMLGVLNCLPIPPLDGGRAVSNLMPLRWAWHFQHVERFGFIILLILMVTNVLNMIIIPPIVVLSNSVMAICGIY
ncbi:MAG: site-2 protease family protein [Gammaproteobacteria bacterium]|nr:site-2 protease family protein [Gammaproteobacteria bacterium]